MPRKLSERERIRNLIALDADALMVRLDERKDEMIAMFSRHRDREPLLSPLRSWVPSASFQEIVLLAPAQQGAVAHFYEELDALRWYFRYTADMPGTALQIFAHHRKRLVLAYEGLKDAIGPAQPVPPSAPEAPPVLADEKQKRAPRRKATLRQMSSRKARRVPRPRPAR
jgi:hypothetical protein